MATRRKTHHGIPPGLYLLIALAAIAVFAPMFSKPKASVPLPRNDNPIIVLPTQTEFSPSPVPIDVIPSLPPSPTIPACETDYQSAFDSTSMVKYHGCVKMDGALNNTLEFALRQVPTGIQLSGVTVEVFDSINDIVEWELAHGANVDEATLKNGWTYGSTRAKAYEKYASVVLYVKPGIAQGEIVKDLLHEVQHLIQAQWLGGKFNKPIPVWLIEGGAEWRSRLQQSQLGYTPLDTTPSLPGCTYNLQKLYNVPQEGDNEGCWYVEGEQVQILLVRSFGDRYDALWANLSTMSFEAAFQATYGISYTDFQTMFDSYVAGGFQ